MKEFALINECKYLYLDRLYEPRDNFLRIIVQEASSSRQSSEMSSAPFSNASPITHSSGHRIFEIEWSTYIAYSVLNESYAENGDEVYEGNLLRLYAKSSFLNYVATSTIATPDYPGPYQHWSVVCLNHVIEVVSTSQPNLVVRVAS